MFRLSITLYFFLSCTIITAQNVFRAEIRDAETEEPVLGANVSVTGTEIGAVTNIEGKVVLENVPDGEQRIIVSYVGYLEQTLDYEFPVEEGRVFRISLVPATEEIEGVMITSTRSRRTIADIPTRVEAISGEELEEKGNMKPGNIRMLLNETTGIQTQQTSATSYNSSIRIQGLDGKYTQLLKDGYPLYSGFSGGLSLLQIVPLDLRQVEVIKGASSTLYGGGAIAGLVNLISKPPSEERELNFLINGTSALGLDLSGFYSNTFNKVGTTIFASYNLGNPYDPADIGLTAIPEFERVTVNPRFFFDLGEGGDLNVGVNTVIEERTGGNIEFLEGNDELASPYFEKNKTQRITTRLGYDKEFANSSFRFKNSLSFFEREIAIPDYRFSGTQFAAFNEATYEFGERESEWIAGFNFNVDKFEQENKIVNPVDYEHLTYGAFVQNTWIASPRFSFEFGLRADYQNEYGFFLLPRFSGLFTISEHLTARLGAGQGYKTPTIFTEDAERIQFQNVLPIDVSETEAEESIGANFDFTYRNEFFGWLDFDFNTLFFYTKVEDPLVLEQTGTNLFGYRQPDGYIDTKGIESNVKLGYSDFKLFVGYTLADVNEHYQGQSSPMPLVSTHRLNNVLMYELEDNLKIGLEAYYYGPQRLTDGKQGEEFWIFGLMTEKIWEKFSIFLNFENFTDTRQTRFGSIYTGSISDPQFRDIYAPLDGFLINGGIKLKL